MELGSPGRSFFGKVLSGMIERYGLPKGWKSAKDLVANQEGYCGYEGGIITWEEYTSWERVLKEKDDGTE